jgi:hypothetical protein
MVKLMTSYFTVTVEDRVNNSCCVQHRLETLYMPIDFFNVFRQVGSELIDEHSWGQGIMSQRAIDLFSLVLNPANFLSD